MIWVLRSFRVVTRLCHVLCYVQLCVTVRRVSLWKFDFIVNIKFCNASVECNLNHFIVYLIIYANLCFFQCTIVKCYALGRRYPTEIEQGFFSGFPLMQSGMFVILCNTIFNYCNCNIYVYIFTCGPYIQMYLVWPFMPSTETLIIQYEQLCIPNPLI